MNKKLVALLSTILLFCGAIYIPINETLRLTLLNLFGVALVISLFGAIYFGFLGFFNILTETEDK